MSYKVLVSAPPILPHLEEYYELCLSKGVELFKPDFEVIESLNEAELIKLLKDADGILCGDDEINAKVLQESKKLKIISKWGTGIDSIDVNEADKLGIKVSRVVDVFADPLSDTVLAYILMISRKILEKDDVVRKNNWSKISSYTVRERVLGIVGLGHIGKELARKATSLGMEVLFYDTKDIVCDIPNTRKVDFDNLLKNSDFISIHCDLNDESKHMFAAKEFSKMKDDSVIINTARGSIINEKDLIVAIQESRIAGACLDVFEKEPLANESPLKGLKNVFLSPHNSNASPSVFKTVDIKSIENIFEGLGVN